MKQVFYVQPLPNKAFLDVLGTRTDVKAVELRRDASGQDIAAVLESSVAYQIGSMRDELAPGFRADASLLGKAPRLLAVSTHGAGFDTIDVDACTNAGVLAVNQAGGNAEAVAEHVMAMMLCLTKRIGETDRFMRRQNNIPRAVYIGHNVLGKTIGIIGIGHVGSRVAELCRGLFQMRVLGFDPYLSAEQLRAKGVEKVELADLLRQSDYVSVNCPLTSETRGLVSVREFALMQPHAYFISTARGSITDEEALTQALREQRIAGAGLDVWEQEPPPASHPMMQFDNVLLSPHTAGVTVESRRNIATIAAEQMLAILDGKRPPRLLNPQVWPAYVKRFERVMGFKPEG